MHKVKIVLPQPDSMEQHMGPRSPECPWWQTLAISQCWGGATSTMHVQPQSRATRLLQPKGCSMKARPLKQRESLAYKAYPHILPGCVHRKARGGWGHLKLAGCYPLSVPCANSSMQFARIGLALAEKANCENQLAKYLVRAANCKPFVDSNTARNAFPQSSITLQ